MFTQKKNGNKIPSEKKKHKYVHTKQNAQKQKIKRVKKSDKKRKLINKKK